MKSYVFINKDRINATKLIDRFFPVLQGVQQDFC